LDFKIFVRLTILELKLIIFPSIPPVKELTRVQNKTNPGFMPKTKSSTIQDQMVDML